MLENPIALLFLIVLITSFLGFSISFLFLNVDLTRRLLIGPIIGYAIISLATAYLNYAGFGTDMVSMPLFLCLIVLSLGAIVYHRHHITLKALSSKFLVTVLLFGLVNAAIVLAPTVLARAPSLFNDNTIYISISQYVRGQSYSSLAQPKTAPWEQYTWENQVNHFRMGSKFFVAFFASVFDAPHTLWVYPSILGLLAILVFNAISILYLSLRKTKDASQFELSFILFFCLAAINLNSSIITQGFLCQTFGLILLITLGALFYECMNRKTYYVTIALLFAALVLTYHEITIFYLAASGGYLLYTYFFKKHDDKKVYLYFLLAHLLALILSPIATKELLLGIMSSYHLNGVGWHISDSFITYIQSIFGQDAHKFSSSLLFLPGSFVPLLFIYFIVRKNFIQSTKNILRFLIIWSMPFLMGLILYRFFKVDPFTHELGHTWNIFKIVNWSYWIIPCMTGFATYAFFKVGHIHKVIAFMGIVLLTPSISANIFANYVTSQYGMHLFTNNYQNPLDDFKTIALAREQYSPANLITYESHQNYTYLVLSLLRNISTGDLTISGSKYMPSLSKSFFTWMNYRKEYASSTLMLKNLAGFHIYPPESSVVYLDKGFSEKEQNGVDHYAWMQSHDGTIKIIIPQGKKAQFTTIISNWRNQKDNFKIYFQGQVIYQNSTDFSGIQFTSPILGEGLFEFSVKYEGPVLSPDKVDDRSFTLMFKNTTIKTIQ